MSRAVTKLFTSVKAVFVLFVNWHFGFPSLWEDVGERGLNPGIYTEFYLRRNLQTGSRTPKVSCIVDTQTLFARIKWPERVVERSSLLIVEDKNGCCFTSAFPCVFLAQH
jgi:hypothetical protein